MAGIFLHVSFKKLSTFASDQKEQKERARYLKKTSLTSTEREEQKQLNRDDIQVISNGAYRYMVCVCVHVRMRVREKCVCIYMYMYNS